MTLSLVPPSPEHLPIRDLISPAHASFTADTTVADTVARLREVARGTFVTYCFVVGPREKLLGVVSMRELLLAEPGQRLEEVMTHDPFTLDVDAGVLEAMTLVLPHHFPIYPVVDREGRLVGVLRGSRLFEALPVTLVTPSDPPASCALELRGGLITHDRTIPGEIRIDQEAVQFTAPQRQPTRLLLRSVRKVRHAPGVPGVGIGTIAGDLRLALAPEDAARLADALLSRCGGIERTPPAEEPELPEIGGRAEVSINGAPAAAGTLHLDAQTLWFEGASPTWKTPIAAVVAVERIDPSRVRIVTNREEIVARGEGAQRVWVGLTVRGESRLGAGGVVPRVFEQDTEQPNTGWFWGIARRSFGGVGPTRFLGTTRWFWHGYAALHRLRIGPGTLEIAVAGETLVFVGPGAERFGLALPEAWLAAMPALECEGTWGVRAVLPCEGVHEFGALTKTPEGVVFVSDGGDKVLALHGASVLPVVDPHHAHVLGVETQAGRTIFLVADPAGAVEALRRITTSQAWEVPDPDAAPVRLDPDNLGVLAGAAAYVSVLREGLVVATGRDVYLQPDEGRLHFAVSLSAGLPPIPCVGALEVGGPHGRYMVAGALVNLTADGARGRYLATFQLGGAPTARNRREYFRLPLREHAVLLRVNAGHTDVLPGETTLMNLSQRGCRVRCSWPLDGGERCRIELAVSDRRLSLDGEVVYALRGDGQAWEVAIAWLAQSAHDGAALYHDRELASLRKRRAPAR
jgi:hypothetical protein